MFNFDVPFRNGLVHTSNKQLGWITILSLGCENKKLYFYLSLWLQSLDHIIPNVELVRDLVVFDRKLTFDCHGVSCYNKAMKMLGCVKRNTKDI